MFVDGARLTLGNVSQQAILVISFWRYPDVNRQAKEDRDNDGVSGQVGKRMSLRGRLHLIRKCGHSADLSCQLENSHCCLDSDILM